MEIFKEFATTKDMEDPAFYSTCYLREMFRGRWKQFPKIFPPGEWAFGDQCLDCESYIQGAENLNSGDTQGRKLTRWLPAPRCVNCSLNAPRLNFSGNELEIDGVSSIDGGSSPVLDDGDGCSRLAPTHSGETSSGIHLGR